MFDPSIGIWTTEDPIGFDAGDFNLRRYVGNQPTNASDQSGLVEVQGRIGPGTALPFPKGTVNTAYGDSAMTLIPGATFTVQSGVNLPARKDKRATDNFIAVAISGKQGIQQGNVQWLQFYWVQLFTQKGNNEDGKPNFVAEEKVANIKLADDRIRKSTVTPKTPTWFLDNGKADTSPYYDEGGPHTLGGGQYTIYDRPDLGRGNLPLIFKGREQTTLAPSDRVIIRPTVVRAVFHFDTYALVVAQPVFKLSWTATQDWTCNIVDKKFVWSAAKTEYAITGAPQANQQPMLNATEGGLANAWKGTVDPKYISKE